MIRMVRKLHFILILNVDMVPHFANPNSTSQNRHAVGAICAIYCLRMFTDTIGATYLRQCADRSASYMCVCDCHGVGGSEALLPSSFAGNRCSWSNSSDTTIGVGVVRLKDIKIMHYILFAPQLISL